MTEYRSTRAFERQQCPDEIQIGEPRRAAEAMREAVAQHFERLRSLYLNMSRDKVVARIRAIPLPESSPDPRDAEIVRLSAERDKWRGMVRAFDPAHFEFIDVETMRGRAQQLDDCPIVENTLVDRLGEPAEGENVGEFILGRIEDMLGALQKFDRMYCATTYYSELRDDARAALAKLAATKGA